MRIALDEAAPTDNHRPLKPLCVLPNTTTPNDNLAFLANLICTDCEIWTSYVSILVGLPPLLPRLKTLMDKVKICAALAH